jgi:hypothetical protein
MGLMDDPTSDDAALLYRYGFSACAWKTKSCGGCEHAVKHDMFAEAKGDCSLCNCMTSGAKSHKQTQEKE